MRPVVILSQDVFNQRSGTVIAMAITSQSQRAGFPLTLELTGSRLPKRSWVKISQIRTLAVSGLGRRSELLPRTNSNKSWKVSTKSSAPNPCISRPVAKSSGGSASA
jgi:mRNA-degrading endonuclease toxin of MazEF toxin-antitoxin module